MLSRNLVGASRAGLRCLSTTASRGGHTPRMGDINPTPESVEDFNQRQKQFREKLAEARKKRDAGALKHAPAHGEEPGTHGISPGLGSLSTATDKVAELKESEPPRKHGRLSNLIYGTKEGREMDAQIEASFSAVLARGKYVHSIVFHQVKPDKVDEYVALTGEWYPKMANSENNNLHLVGSFRTEVGDCDTFGRLSRGEFSSNADPWHFRSPHLGVPAIPGLPRVDTPDLLPPRVPRVSAEAA